MPRCRDAARLVAESHDRRRGWMERLGLFVHLLYCTGCRRARAQLRTMRRILRSEVDGEVVADGPSTPMPTEARARVGRALVAAPPTGAPAEPRGAPAEPRIAPEQPDDKDA